MLTLNTPLYVANSGRLIDPRQIPGLALWLDAADRSTITTETGVREWRDKSGNGRHLSQASGSQQPAYVELACNGLPAVRADGVDDQLVAGPYPSTDFFGPGKNAVTIVSVTRRVGNDGRFFWSLRNTAGPSGEGITCDRQPLSVGTADVGIVTNSASAGVSLAPEMGGALIIETVTWKSGGPLNLRRFVDGIATTYSSPAAAGTIEQEQRFTVAPSSVRVNADHHEYLIWPRELTSGEITQIETYLANKWKASTPQQPQAISGLSLWLDAADPGSISLGSGVVQAWVDKSGNGRHVTQSTTANRPGYVAGDGIQFTSSLHQLTNATSINITTNLTAFVAFRCTDTASYSTTAGNDTFVNHAAWSLQTISSQFWGRFAVTKSGVATRAFTGITQIKTTDRIFRVAANATDIRARVIGATTQDDTVAAMTAGNVGGTLIGTFPRGNMVIREVLVYSVALTDAQISQIESYLASKWGV